MIIALVVLCLTTNSAASPCRGHKMCTGVDSFCARNRTCLPCTQCSPDLSVDGGCHMVCGVGDPSDESRGGWNQRIQRSQPRDASYGELTNEQGVVNRMWLTHGMHELKLVQGLQREYSTSVHGKRSSRHPHRRVATEVCNSTQDRSRKVVTQEPAM